MRAAALRPPRCSFLSALARNEGRHEGELHARREILGRLLARAGLQPTASEQAQIATCEDTAVLDRWIEQTFNAHDVAQVLA